MSGGGCASVETFEILIPELEEAVKQYKPSKWSMKEEAIMSKYYGRVHIDDLIKQLPGKTLAAVHNKAADMGLTKRKRVIPYEEQDMKFICRVCIDECISSKPCILSLKGIAKNNERENWREALRRCPFEDDTDGRFSGVSPRAEWERYKP
jgi:hypothetical protein